MNREGIRLLYNLNGQILQWVAGAAIRENDTVRRHLSAHVMMPV